MSRLKLGIGLMMAMGACVALSAPAYATVEFDSISESYPATAEAVGSGGAVFSFGKTEGEVKCATSRWLGKLEKEAESMTFAPTYEKCEAKVAGIGSSLAVKAEGCKYELTSPEQNGEEKEEVEIHEFKTKWTLKGCKMVFSEVKALKGCVVEIGEQGPLTAVDFDEVSNEKAEREESEIKSAVKEIAYTSKGCSEFVAEKGKNGEYTNTLTDAQVTLTPNYVWHRQHPEGSTAKFEGVGTAPNEFTFNGMPGQTVTVSCTAASSKFAGELPRLGWLWFHILKVKPEYMTCGGGWTAGVTTCKWALKDTSMAPTGMKFPGAMSLLNEGGTCNLQMENGGCKLKLKNQIPTGTNNNVKYESNAAGNNPREVTDEFELLQLKFEAEGAGCTITAGTYNTGGAYKGGLSVKHVSFS